MTPLTHQLAAALKRLELYLDRVAPSAARDAIKAIEAYDAAVKAELAERTERVGKVGGCS